jgi:hypothetical protein
MPLKFQCNQDPRKMKTVNGVKFCEVCKKNVFDVRRKSLEKINEMGECCVIIYQDQMKKCDELRKNKTVVPRKIKHNLPFAAGFAAASLLPAAMHSQNPATVPATQTTGRDTEGTKLNSTSLNNKASEKKSLVFKGNITSSPKKSNKKHTITVGYYTFDADSNLSSSIPVFEFTSKKDGSFTFELTEAQLSLLKGKNIYFETGRYSVDYEVDHLDASTGIILLGVRGRVWMGAKF